MTRYSLEPIIDSLPPGWEVRVRGKTKRGIYNVARVINAIGGCVIEVKTEASIDLLMSQLAEKLRTHGYYPPLERDGA